MSSSPTAGLPALYRDWSRPVCSHSAVYVSARSHTSGTLEVMSGATIIAEGSVVGKDTTLWLSNQPGISSMGKLLALSFVCTLTSAALFQPALMGEPRRPAGDTPSGIG
jgi:hypothetical protein